MKDTTQRTLYAIYKNGVHKGNERATSASDAIKNYVIASHLGDLLGDKSFMEQYSAIIAIADVHYSPLRPSSVRD